MTDCYFELCMCAHSNVDEESSLNRDALRIRRCILSDDDGNTKEYHSGRLGNNCCMCVSINICTYLYMYTCAVVIFICTAHISTRIDQPLIIISSNIIVQWRKVLARQICSGKYITICQWPLQGLCVCTYYVCDIF